MLPMMQECQKSVAALTRGWAGVHVSVGGSALACVAKSGSVFRQLSPPGVTPAKAGTGARPHLSDVALKRYCMHVETCMPASVSFRGASDCGSTSSLHLWPRQMRLQHRVRMHPSGRTAAQAAGRAVAERLCPAGKVFMWDVASRKVLGSVAAHTGVTTSLCPVPDANGLLTAGADCSIKFWRS